MPTRNVNLTPELDRFIVSRVESGLYANASEVMRAALRLMEQEQREYDEKMTVLRAAIQEGLDSGIAEPGVFERVHAYLDQLEELDREPEGVQEEAWPSTA
jgi:antitoxin ParD1/3/4